MARDLALVVAEAAFEEGGGFAQALDPGFGHDEAGAGALQEADLDLQAERREPKIGLRHHQMRHCGVDPAGDEAALHDAAGMAVVRPGAVMDHGAAALAVVDDLFEAERGGEGVRLGVVFVHGACSLSLGWSGGGGRPGSSSSGSGAQGAPARVSAIRYIATRLSRLATIKYQAGAIGLPVT
ncbi:MAG: hypothetical protein WDN03_00590 [Rhizomicrobium sp.]